MKRKNLKKVLLIMLVMLVGSQISKSAGLLIPTSGAVDSLKIVDHHLNVTINNGFAVTEVFQTFKNDDSNDLEAIYSFPVPKNGRISEVTIYSGENEINGEVLKKEQAKKIYNEEKSKGNNAGLAEKNEFYDFKFYVYPVKANDIVKIRFVYIQPLEIELGVGKFIYPLEEGNTDEKGKSFWEKNSKVENSFTANIELKSSYPVTSVRIPDYEKDMIVNKLDENNYKITLDLNDKNLNKDLVFYYKLQDNLPGRVEMIPYKNLNDKTGKFMMVITPGIDLKLINTGADYTFVLDISGSMDGKLHTLAEGVSKALQSMSSQDRFRIITFNDYASDITNGWIEGSKENVDKYIKVVKNIRSSGSTDLYSGLKKSFTKLDSDRVSNIILVTDGVTNTGIVDPIEFYKLTKKYDVRIFGYLMGNGSNWPIMNVICKGTGGYSAGISNSDDIIGAIMMAKDKVLYESLHNVDIKISGVKTFNLTKTKIKKVFRGQQIILFGEYENGGMANLKIKASLSGEDKIYKTEFEFPKVDTENPEIERLWAIARIEDIKTRRNVGLFDENESKTIIADLGVEYQIVTDETSMVVVSDEVFKQNNIERKNKKRIKIENKARSIRNKPSTRSSSNSNNSNNSGKSSNNYKKQSRTVDRNNRAFRGHSSSVGGGAVDPFTALLGLITAGIGFFFNKKGRK